MQHRILTVTQNRIAFQTRSCVSVYASVVASLFIMLTNKSNNQDSFSHCCGSYVLPQTYSKIKSPILQPSSPLPSPSPAWWWLQSKRLLNVLHKIGQKKQIRACNNYSQITPLQSIITNSCHVYRAYCKCVFCLGVRARECVIQKSHCLCRQTLIEFIVVMYYDNDYGNLCSAGIACIRLSL